MKILKTSSTLITAFMLSISFACLVGNAQAETTAKFTKDGELVLPKGYREWIFIGTPLTPNDMNNGKAAFPEFHNVYMNPTSFAYWRKNGEFRDGTVIVKELVSVGTKQAASGNGYFQGDYLGVEAAVKDAKHFPNEPGHWGFFRFTDEKNFDFKALKAQAKANATENCAACHQANAEKDLVFIQHYPVLRATKP